MAKTIISIIAGGILFALFARSGGGLFTGMALGFLLARTSAQKKLLQGMEKRLKDYEALVDFLSRKSASVAPSRQKELQSSSLSSQERLKTASHPGTASSDHEVSFQLADEEKVNGQAAPVPPVSSTRPNFTKQLFRYVQDFFTQGNVLLRVGLLVLFFG
ncbi:hypothetical protein VU04_12055, partial [Desulfobulbus sp. TB]|nr:hypothetical protein [Desulfobulbus sp. TB]